MRNKSSIGVNCEDLGKDGLSAYELWAMSQPYDADTSQDAFFDSLKGSSVESISVSSKEV